MAALYQLSWKQMQENIAEDDRLEKFNLLYFPNDVLLCVKDHLPKVDRLMLSLTCKDMHEMCGKVARNLTRTEREDVYERLGRDGPKLFHCFRCNRMHTFAADTGPVKQEETEHPTATKRHRQDEWTPLNGLYHSFYSNEYSIDDSFSSEEQLRNRNQNRSEAAGAITTYNLHFHHAQLVMLRHRRGAPYGIPVSNLEANIRKRYDNGVKIEESWRPRIINDELYLAVTHVISHEFASESNPLPEMLHAQPHRICKHHTTIYNPYRSSVNADVPISPDFRKQFDLSICRRCLTEWESEIWYEPRVGWIIKIQAYHQLGQCNSPEEDKWRAFIVPGSITYTDNQAFGRNKGQLKKMWEEDVSAESQRAAANKDVAIYEPSMRERRNREEEMFKAQDRDDCSSAPYRSMRGRRTFVPMSYSSNFIGTGRRLDGSTNGGWLQRADSGYHDMLPMAPRRRVSTIFDEQEAPQDNFRGPGQRLG